jgi:hypothetical protein
MVTAPGSGKRKLTDMITMTPVPKSHLINQPGGYILSRLYIVFHTPLISFHRSFREKYAQPYLIISFYFRFRLE